MKLKDLLMEFEFCISCTGWNETSEMKRVTIILVDEDQIRSRH